VKIIELPPPSTGNKYIKIGVINPQIRIIQNLYFSIYFFISAFFPKLSANVLQLKEVATSQDQAKTNITQTFEFSEKIRKYALA